MKCCNRPHHVTAVLAVAAEAAITKVHVPAVVLTDLTATPNPSFIRIFCRK
ncbi:MAG: hypothetical protein [Bacteriophage sp.]|nr:MAG: hypothetical protein [Bacteriophage sp.]